MQMKFLSFNFKLDGYSDAYSFAFCSSNMNKCSWGGGYSLEAFLLHKAEAWRVPKVRNTSFFRFISKYQQTKKLHKDIVCNQAEQGCRSNRCVRGVFCVPFFEVNDVPPIRGIA